jgi:3-oxoacyl-[acyl-carrier protein] reductase
MSDAPAGALAFRRILVTGATGAIGRAVAHELSSAGALLVLVARHRDALDGLIGELDGGPHVVIDMDVTDESAWQHAIALVAPEGELHGIVTAAGVIAPIGPIGTYHAEQFRRTLDVNVLGTLLPIVANLDALRAGRGSVVTLSGGGATGPFPRFDAYAASKAAVVRLTENLASVLATDDIRVNAVAPGFVVSAMHDEELALGPELVGAAYYARSKELQQTGGDSPERAAQLIAFLLSEEAREINGKLLSAQWDPWEDPAFRARCASEKDFATLRRIDDQFFSARERP